MNRHAVVWVIATAALFGCTERRMFITSEPMGARVWLNDQEVGETPVEVDFTWFGVYDVRLHKKGFEPLVTTAEAKAPLHEMPGIDLVAMAIPGKDVTHIHWNFELVPTAQNDAGLLDRARELRDQEQAIQAANAEIDAAPAPETDDPAAPD